jgi:DNA repair ATPase RecN
MEELFKGKQMSSIMTRVDAAAGNLERLTSRATKTLNDSALDQTMAEAREALKGARIMLGTVNEQVLAMKLPATVNETRDLARSLQNTGNNLRQSSETLEKLLQRIYERPSDILLGNLSKKVE